MACQMVATEVTLNDLESHSPVAGLFKCNPSNTCAAFYTISTGSVLARFPALAELLLSLYCTTLQHHVRRTMVRCGCMAHVCWTTCPKISAPPDFQSALWANISNRNYLLLHDTAAHLWQFDFHTPCISVLTYLLKTPSDRRTLGRDRTYYHVLPVAGGNTKAFIKYKLWSSRSRLTMANLSVHEAVDDGDEYSLQTHTIRSTSCSTSRHFRQTAL